MGTSSNGGTATLRLEAAGLPEGVCYKSVRYLMGDIQECVLFGAEDGGEGGFAALRDQPVLCAGHY